MEFEFKLFYILIWNIIRIFYIIFEFIYLKEKKIYIFKKYFFLIGNLILKDFYLMKKNYELKYIIIII